MQADREATTKTNINPTAENIAEHMHLVHRVVAHFMRRLPRSVQREDLVAAGTMGLFQALRASAHTCSEMFASYARIRIRGAIVDELRRHDWSPRRRRTPGTPDTQASIDNGTTGTTNVIALRRQPAPGGANANANASGNGSASANAEAPASEPRVRIAVVGFDDLPPQLALAATGIAEGDGSSPLDELLERREFEALHAAVDELPPRERAIVRMRYFEGMPSKAIASSLGLSEARISQLHARATSRLREILLNQEGASESEVELAA
ncbi:RNA polymerase sigma factor for flagellar operon [Labilithrix luteola]|uniref:RNA polymerase sigma factor for flagellar operon n=1 Tax=Labilithrix luteola TaxID=1391654 RepID=A0A0K1Q5P5_9BACT|nr:sigma-70 family RNA polymerase sigma factor [Labilithrix luteola]AKV00982.1 RNA polymerase sigma factor for flagellar operon [Labilithrix luteola]